ncbi:RWD domain-containing protein 1-like isoform X1 [Ostrea edulis]|uniref:RWD domain-containing protein 1-like isoform X1 n=1 Tax=Ostrea edulis TaxID=37623 RepID=UPI0020958FCB|nr:RWD domain-containing protein 1-like isoform X1 [Ostrea edulis]
MTDFKEEQNNEIEALESIYPEEIEVLKTEPYHVFTITIHSQESDQSVEEADEATCVVQFTYVEKYPEEPLVFEVIESENLEDDQLEEITSLINEQIEENLGMVVVFTVVSVLQEKLTVMVEDTKKRRQEEADRKQRALEEAEQKRFEGTKVTVETFLAWKAKFDAEMAELKKEKIQKEKTKGLTGKEMFLKDSSMIDSDLKLLESEEDSVQVDESLFQDMDDLDLEEDLEEAGD